MGKRITQVSVGFLIFYELLYNILLALNNFGVVDFYFYDFYQIYSISLIAILLILLAGFVISFIEERGICTFLPMCFFALYLLYRYILLSHIAAMFGIYDAEILSLITCGVYTLYLLSFISRHIANREFLMIVAYIVAIALYVAVRYFRPDSGNEIAEILYFCAAGVFDVALYVLQFASVSADTE